MSEVKTHVTLPSTSNTLDDVYFKFQADIGITKHIGSTKATDELIELCHINEYSTVLDVGCGVGLTSLAIAKKFGARVVGIDARPEMINRATLNAKQAGLASCANFQVMDACNLSLSDNVYDAVICESVLAFIPNQEKALKEWIRVLKPGGYLGFTEAIWMTPPPRDARDLMDTVTGAGGGVQSSEHWEKLLRQSGVVNCVWHKYPLNILADSIHQFQHFGLFRMASAWGKTFQLMVTNPEYRQFARSANKIPKSLMKHIGYGVYVGQALD